LRAGDKDLIHQQPSLTYHNTEILWDCSEADREIDIDITWKGTFEIIE
jgi:hypothetical protein